MDTGLGSHLCRSKEERPWMGGDTEVGDSCSEWTVTGCRGGEGRSLGVTLRERDSRGVTKKGFTDY